MEDFSMEYNANAPKEIKAEEKGLQMMVSPICMKDGEKTAYVTFSDGSRHAEGEIPKCVVIKSEGFDNDEIYQLENYMEENLDMLKSMAASINPIKAMMKDK